MAGGDDSAERGKETGTEQSKEPDGTADGADEPSSDRGDDGSGVDSDGGPGEKSDGSEGNGSPGNGSDDDPHRVGGDEGAIATLKQHVTKRRLLGGVAVLLVLVVVLLVVFVPSSLLALAYSSSAEFEAQPATATADSFTAGEYEHVGTDELVVDEQRAVLGQTKTIIATNYVTDYERSIDVQRDSLDAAIFTLVSTPTIEAAGRPLNPLAGMSHEELLAEFGSELEGEYGELDDLDKVDERESALLGQETNVSRFAMTVDQEGEEITVYLYVATVQSSGDIVVAVGGHPAPFAQERASIFELMAGVEHPSE